MAKNVALSVKNPIEKTTDEAETPYIALLEFWNTPLIWISVVQLLMTKNIYIPTSVVVIE